MRSVGLLSIKELEQYGLFNNWMTGLLGEIKLLSTKYSWALELKVFCEWIWKNSDGFIGRGSEATGKFVNEVGYPM